MQSCRDTAIHHNSNTDTIATRAGEVCTIRFTLNTCHPPRRISLGASRAALFEKIVILKPFVCPLYRRSSRTHWRGILERREAAVPHEDTAAYASAPLHARDPWLLFLSGTLTPQSGVHLRESFRPQSVMLNVTDLEGRRVVV